MKNRWNYETLAIFFNETRDRIKKIETFSHSQMATAQEHKSLRDPWNNKRVHLLLFNFQWCWLRYYRNYFEEEKREKSRVLEKIAAIEKLFLTQKQSMKFPELCWIAVAAAAACCLEWEPFHGCWSTNSMVWITEVITPSSSIHVLSKCMLNWSVFMKQMLTRDNDNFSHLFQTDMLLMLFLEL